MEKILELFHHTHHTSNGHIVHHCGGAHVKINLKLNYIIEHCLCCKHQISKESAIGHDFDMNEIEVIFEERCPYGGWHIESGIMISKDLDENSIK